MIFYIHGFNSLATGNLKIQEVKDFFKKEVTPLDYDSGSSFNDNLLKLIGIAENNQEDEMIFMGTSLGGYYAAQLASLFQGAVAVMLNPALKPYEQLMEFVGENKNFSTGEEYYLSSLTVSSYTKIHIPSKSIFFINKNDELIPSEETIDFAEKNNIDYILFPEGGHRFDSLSNVLSILKEKEFITIN